MGKKCPCENCDFQDELLSSLNDSSTEGLCNICRSKEEQFFRKGEIIIHEGEKIYTINYLKSGTAKIYRSTKTGKDQVMTIIKPFEFVCNLSFFSEKRYQYNVSALDDCIYCMIKTDFIKDVFFKNGNFAMQLVKMISKLNDKIIRQIIDIRKKSLCGKVAYVLLYITKGIYNSRVFNLPISRKEFADYIGVSTANVIRTLSVFTKKEIIKVHGRTIEVVDLNQLEFISENGRFR